MTKKPVGLKDFKTEMVPIAVLIPFVNNPKAHPAGQVDKIASSIKNFGFLVPLVIDGGNEIVAGYGRLLAAQKLGLGVVPCVRADNLTPAEIRAFRLADNKVAESDWFPEVPRLLTPKEAGLLISFPEVFKWSGSKCDVRARIGNAVPPLFMKAIVEHIRSEILSKAAPCVK